ncbi:MAG TPA: hypothetical protein VGM69_05105 [Chloroflexota bacterium]
MSASGSRRVFCLGLGGIGLLLATGCSGEQSSYAGNKIEAVPTSVSGASTTSGISAGAALSAPGGSGTPTATPTPTVTPAPTK